MNFDQATQQLILNQLQKQTELLERLHICADGTYQLLERIEDMAKATSKTEINPNTAMQSNGNKVTVPTNADRKPTGKAPKGGK